MVMEKQENRGGPRNAGPGKVDGRPTNRSKGLPNYGQKQFALYPADVAILEALLAGSKGTGSAFMRGLIRRAAGLSSAEVAEVVAEGKRF